MYDNHPHPLRQSELAYHLWRYITQRRASKYLDKSTLDVLLRYLETVLNREAADPESLSVDRDFELTGQGGEANP